MGVDYRLTWEPSSLMASKGTAVREMACSRETNARVGRTATLLLLPLEDRQTDRQTDGQTDRQTDRQTD